MQAKQPEVSSEQRESWDAALEYCQQFPSTPLCQMMNEQQRQLIFAVFAAGFRAGKAAAEKEKTSLLLSPN